MLKIRRPLGRLIFNMGIAIPGKTVFLIETAPSTFARSYWNCVKTKSQWHSRGYSGQLTTRLECTGVNFNTLVLILNCVLALAIYIFVGLIWMLWHMETHINPQRYRYLQQHLPPFWHFIAYNPDNIHMNLCEYLFNMFWSRFSLYLHQREKPCTDVKLKCKVQIRTCESELLLGQMLDSKTCLINRQKLRTKRQNVQILFFSNKDFHQRKPWFRDYYLR